MNQHLALLINLINAGITVYLYHLFFSSFAKPKYQRWITTLVLFGIMLISSVGLLFLGEMLPRFIFFAGAAIILSVFYRQRILYGVFMSLAVYAICAISEFLTSALVSITFQIDIHTAMTERYFILGIFLSKIVTLLFILIIRFSKHKMLRTAFRREIFIAFLIPISTICVLLLQYEYYLSISEFTPFFTTLSTLCYLFMLISNLVVFNIIDRIYQNIEQEVQIQIANELITQQETQYLQLLSHNQNISKIKHDEKNLLFGLLSDIREQKYADAITVLEERLQILQEPLPIDCKNSVISTIIISKEQEAQKSGIELCAEYQGLPQINIPATDIAIILGNILDNAIEAVQRISDDRPKTINLLVKAVHDNILIIVKNPTWTDIDVTNLKSEKSDKHQHGYGILNIRNLVQQHQGDAIFTCENKIFETRVIMKNE